MVSETHTTSQPSRAKARPTTVRPVTTSTGDRIVAMVDKLTVGAPVRLAAHPDDQLRALPSTVRGGWHVVAAKQHSFIKVAGSNHWVAGDRIIDYANVIVVRDDPEWRAPWYAQMDKFSRNIDATPAMVAAIRGHYDAYIEFDIALCVQNERHADTDAAVMAAIAGEAADREAAAILGMLRLPADQARDRVARARYLDVLGMHGEWLNTDGAHAALIEGWLAASAVPASPVIDVSQLSVHHAGVVMDGLRLAYDAVLGVANRPNAGDINRDDNGSGVLDQYWVWLGEELARVFDHVLTLKPRSDEETRRAEHIFAKYYADDGIDSIRAEFQRWLAGPAPAVPRVAAAGPVDWGQFSLSELFQLLNMTIAADELVANFMERKDISPALVGFLENGLDKQLYGICADIAEHVLRRPLGDERGAAEKRSWILTTVRLRAAEGIVSLVGPGAPDYLSSAT